MHNFKELIAFSKPFSALYVEDDIAIRDNYAKIFQELFSSVELAENGKEGWEKYQQTPYDIIITDINMPVMNGIEMVGNIIARNPRQSITVTSAHDESKYHQPLKELGVENFLIKPIEFQKLIDLLLSITKRLSEEKAQQRYQEEVEKKLHTADLQ